MARSLEKAAFQVFFWRKSSFSAISTEGRPPLHMHRGKAMDLSFLTILPKGLHLEPVARQNFANASGMVDYKIWHCVVSRCIFYSTNCQNLFLCEDLSVRERLQSNFWKFWVDRGLSRNIYIFCSPGDGGQVCFSFSSYNFFFSFSLG